MPLKTHHILLLAGLLTALLSCTSESVKNALLQQEQSIERYIQTRVDELKRNAANPDTTITVYYLDGIYRIVLEAGTGEGAAAGDSVVFDYEGYIFASRKGDRYTAGSDHNTLGSGSYFAGLETGLTGMCSGEHSEIILSGDKAYGNVPMGILPPNTPLIFEIWMTRVVKQ
jgi:FKBP-type peptidyl-prolyl cis-trans isomerase